MRPLEDTGCVCVAFVIQNDSRSDTFPFKSLRVFTLLCSNIVTPAAFQSPPQKYAIRNNLAQRVRQEDGSKDKIKYALIFKIKNPSVSAVQKAPAVSKYILRKN